MANPNHEVVNHPAPAEYATAVTPSDSTDLTKVARALYVGTGGNISLNTPDGATVLFSNVQAGSILPIRAKRINATNTTASNIVALY